MKMQRTLSLIGYYVFLAMVATRNAFVAREQGIDLILAIAIALSATLACIADSKVLAKSMSHAAKWVMLFVWPIAVPIYLLWSRGWRGFIWIGIHLVATLAIVAGFTFFFMEVLGVVPR